MTLAQLDRTLFEHLRLELVAKGYLPAYPPSGVLVGPDWEAALVAHTGTLIEIFGVGIPTNRGVKDGNRIVINRKTMALGGLGGNTPYFVKNEPENPMGTFTKRRRALQSHNVFYEIRTVCASAKVDRLATELIIKVMGTGRYLTIYKDGDNVLREFDDSCLMLRWDGTTDIKAMDQLEQVHKYYFEDAWIGEDEVLGENIPPLTKITAQIKDLKDYSTAEEFDHNAPPTVDEVIIE